MKIIFSSILLLACSVFANLEFSVNDNFYYTNEDFHIFAGNARLQGEKADTVYAKMAGLSFPDDWSKSFCLGPRCFSPNVDSANMYVQLDVDFNIQVDFHMYSEHVQKSFVQMVYKIGNSERSYPKTFGVSKSEGISELETIKIPANNTLLRLDESEKMEITLYLQENKSYSVTLSPIWNPKNMEYGVQTIGTTTQKITGTNDQEKLSLVFSSPKASSSIFLLEVCSESKSCKGLLVDVLKGENVAVEPKRIQIDNNWKIVQMRDMIQINVEDEKVKSTLFALDGRKLSSKEFVGLTSWTNLPKIPLILEISGQKGFKRYLYNPLRN